MQQVDREEGDRAVHGPLGVAVEEDGGHPIAMEDDGGGHVGVFVVYGGEHFVHDQYNEVGGDG